MYERPVPSTPTANPVPPGVMASRQPAGGSAARGQIVSMLEVSLQRLEEIVDQETTALKTRKVIDLKDFNDRKSQALLELTRVLRTMQGMESSPETVARVSSLKAKLVVNQQVLKMHLEAVREISTTISDAIRQADSDGTYTQAISASSRRA